MGIYIKYWFGPMGCGKSAALIQQAQYSKSKDQSAYHCALKLSHEKIDEKNASSHIKSRNGLSVQCLEGLFEDVSAVLGGIQENQKLIVYIDEFQFISQVGLEIFDNLICSLAELSQKQEINASFYISGLDLDYKKNYWSSHLWFYDHVPKEIKLDKIFINSICQHENCDEVALFSKKLSDSQELYDNESKYIATCEKHFEK